MTIHFSDSIEALAPALALAQAQMGSAQLDSKNGHFRSRYASLASCLHAALSPLSEQGLSLLQHPSYDPSSQIVSVTTCIMHKSGQCMKSTCSLPLGGKMGMPRRLSVPHLHPAVPTRQRTRHPPYRSVPRT